MANPELGTKQVCPNCQAKFYDLGRRPATCPKCGTAFDPEEAVRSRRVRARSAAPDYESDEEVPKKAAETEEGDEERDDTPEIDEAAAAEPVEVDEAEEDAPAPGAEPELGVDFEEEEEADAEADDVPFLVEEEEDFPDEDIEAPDAEEEDR